MAAMLRHKPTGTLYVRTSLLAARGDMEPVVEEVQNVEPVAEEAAVKPSRKPRKSSSYEPDPIESEE